MDTPISSVETRATQHCVVPGCARDAAAPRRMCWPHYKRGIRYGSPTAGRPSFEGEPLAWVEWAVEQETDKCLLFPFAGASLYGTVIYSGRSMVAARAADMMAHGPPGERIVTHNCKSKSCCNKRHIEWGTHLKNQRDRFRDGTHLLGVRNPLAKLVEADICAIRALRGVLTQTDIGETYGVAQSTVSSIQRRATWKHVA